VLEIEFDVFPQSPHLPAVEVRHFEQKSKFALGRDQLLNRGNEMQVVLFREFPRYMNFDNLIRGPVQKSHGHDVFLLGKKNRENRIRFIPVAIDVVAQ
jgi:hypothetical protein